MIFKGDQNYIIVADDTGLEIESLNGEPGTKVIDLLTTKLGIKLTIIIFKQEQKFVDGWDTKWRMKRSLIIVLKGWKDSRTKVKERQH